MDDTLLLNKRVLVVEDNKINQMLVKHSLAKYKVHVTEADDAKSAIKALKEKEFDYILLDIFLPDIKGYEVATIIRKELKLETPVFAITSLAIEGERDICIAAGMNGYISKPFSVKKFLDSIKSDFKIGDKDDKLIGFIAGDENTTIDLEFLYTVAENDKAYIQLMLNMFIDTMPPLLENMKQACEQEQWDKLRELAHYAKSSLSVIKVKQMIQLMNSIGNRCKTLTGLKEVKNEVNQLPGIYEKSKEILKGIPV